MIRSFQANVEDWAHRCFGTEVANDKLERGDRLLEEVLELLQSGDYPVERIKPLTDYVYGRPKGEPYQEMGGVMVTLAAYGNAHDLDLGHAGTSELARVNSKIDIIREKQKNKPKGSALPVAQVEQKMYCVTAISFSGSKYKTLTEHIRASSEEVALGTSLKGLQKDFPKDKFENFRVFEVPNL